MKLAAEPGFEPGQKDSKSSVLPLHNSASYPNAEGRARTDMEVAPQQFFDVFLEIYRKAEPVKDVERRRKMDAFRAEWNKHILEDDPSSQTLINNFGRRTAELVYEYLVYL